MNIGLYEYFLNMRVKLISDVDIYISAKWIFRYKCSGYLNISEVDI